MGGEASNLTDRVVKYSFLILSFGAIFLSLTLVLGWLKYSDNVTRVLGSYLFIWNLSLIIFTLFLLIDDLASLASWGVKGFSGTFAENGRRKFLVSLGAFLALFPFVAGNYGMARNLHRWKVYRQKVPFKNLAKGLRGLQIVQLSDIHSGTFRSVSAIKEAVDRINELKPDLILFTGDLVNEIADEIIPYKDAFSKLTAKFGVYSILGNHDYADYHSSRTEKKELRVDKIKKHHTDMGWQLLLDENTVLDINESKLGLIGMENASAKKYFNSYGDINRAISGLKECDFRLLMSHDPSYWKQNVQDVHKNIDLTLSGHTHGCQFGIEIPGFLKWSPVKYMYDEWAGLYQEGSQYLYVNRGFGCLAYPGRVGIRAEITLLELVDA